MRGNHVVRSKQAQGLSKKVIQLTFYGPVIYIKILFAHIDRCNMLYLHQFRVVSQFGLLGTGRVRA